MRICMMNDNFYRGSGIMLAIQRVLASQVFAGDEVYLAGCATRKGLGKSLDDLSFVDPAHYRCFRLMQNGPGLAVALIDFLNWQRQMRFDIIHVHHRRLSVLANLLSSRSGVPVLFTGHLTFPEAAWFKELAPRRMTGVSPAVVEYLRRCTRARQVDLIHNAVPFPDMPMKSATERGGNALAIGRLLPIKGYSTLIDAYAKLRDRNMHRQLEIFGEGPMGPALAAQIHALHLEDRVFLRGFDPEIGRHLRRCAFQVLASEKEGFPNVVVEAAALGIPTLVTDVDGSRDTLPPGLSLPNALPFGDSGALAEALEIWYSSPLQVDEDGRKFHDFLKVRCAPDVVAEAYRQVYAAMICSG